MGAEDASADGLEAGRRGRGGVWRGALKPEERKSGRCRRRGVGGRGRRRAVDGRAGGRSLSGEVGGGVQGERRGGGGGVKWREGRGDGVARRRRAVGDGGTAVAVGGRRDGAEDHGVEFGSASWGGVRQDGWREGRGDGVVRQRRATRAETWSGQSWEKCGVVWCG